MNWKKFITIFLTFIFSMVAFIGCGKSSKTIIKDPSISQQEMTVLNTVSKDALGRSYDQLNAFNGKKYTGLFYFMWLNNMSQEVQEVNELLSTPEGEKDLWDWNSATLPAYSQFMWGKPLYGYYNSSDEWVIRRHIELFTMANIDFLYFDCTNAFTYDTVWTKIMPIIDDFFEQGFNPPQVVFYNFAYTKVTIEHLYKEIYQKNYYPRTWFAPNGKPMIVGSRESSPDGNNLTSIKDLSPELKEFFEVKNVHIGTDVKDNSLPWLSLHFPQPVQGGEGYQQAVNISTAQHVGMPFSRSVYGRDDFQLYNSNWGRGYSHITGENNIERVNEGINFEEQFEILDYEDVDIIMLTGWNEWTVDKLWAPYSPNSIFVDQMNTEFSRDIEMMEGGYGDNFYLQMIRNLRKHTSGTDSFVPYKLTAPKNFGLYLSDSKWSDFGETYLDYNGDASKRDFRGGWKGLHYYDDSNRNDIVKTRMTQDSKNLYVLLETAEDIILDYDNINCMNVMLDTNKDKQGWEGYDFVINRQIGKNGVTSLERATGKGYEFVKVADINYKVSKNRMVIEIPLKNLQLKDKSTIIDFKVADNVTKPEDIMSYYSYGDSAPIGRLNYRYNYVK